MKPAVIILANGDQSRWPEEAKPKQLLAVDGVPIIFRAFAEFTKAMGFSPVVITENQEIVTCVGFENCYAVGQTSNQLATLVKAASRWGSRTICLLGDVYYTDAGVAAIADCKKPVAFYGRRGASRITGKSHGELVAMAWVKEYDALMIRACLNWKDRPLLWSPYRDFALLWHLGLDYLQAKPDVLVEIDDETDDFDVPEDYDRFMFLRDSRKVAP